MNKLQLEIKMELNKLALKHKAESLIKLYEEKEQLEREYKQYGKA